MRQGDSHFSCLGLQLLERRKTSAWSPKWVLIGRIRSLLISSSVLRCIVKERIVLKALWVVKVIEEIRLAVLVILKCRPTHRVAAITSFLTCFISLNLHLSHMVFELFLHHINYYISIPITP